LPYFFVTESIRSSAYRNRSLSVFRHRLDSDLLHRTRRRISFPLDARSTETPRSGKASAAPHRVEPFREADSVRTGRAFSSKSILRPAKGAIPLERKLVGLNGPRCRAEFSEFPRRSPDPNWQTGLSLVSESRPFKAASAFRRRRKGR
jgi:hypothetical protein